MFCCEKTQWFAMRVTYRRELDVKNLLDQQGVSSFIPMHYVIRMAKKRKVRELVPVVHNLIFIHITQTDMKELKKEIIVPDGQMRDFIAVAGTYDEHLLFFKPEEINPAKGTRVRIIGGDFAGYEGIFIKVKGARDRRVVICIQGIIAMAMATISPDLIEVIKEPKKK